jgi:RND family efflux transporter MFP subunit
VRPGRLVAVASGLAVATAAAVFWLRYAAIPTVEVATPRRGPAVQAVYATGIVEPVLWAKVTPLVRGRIVDLCRCEGREVKAGDFLVRLDDGEERAKLAELEARERFLAREAERYRELARTQAATAKAYEQASSELAQARGAIAAVRERIENMRLSAPMDGVVLRRDGEIGEVAEPGQVLLWVGKPRPLWITADVDEEDIPQVAVGQRALIKADAFADRVLDGTVSGVTPKGDPVNKNYRVRIGLPDDTPLLIGMTTEVNIIVRRAENALLIPREAVEDGRVWVVTDGTVERRVLRTGVVSEGAVEVLDGVGETDRVVTTPSPRLAPGRPVRIKGTQSRWAWFSTSR